MDREQWIAIWDYAGAIKAGAAVPIPGQLVVGRFIRVLVDRLLRFWGDHQDTLIPYLTQAAIAAFQALVAAKADIDTVNPPGPR